MNYDVYNLLEELEEVLTCINNSTKITLQKKKKGFPFKILGI